MDSNGKRKESDHRADSGADDIPGCPVNTPTTSYVPLSARISLALLERLGNYIERKIRCLSKGTYPSSGDCTIDNCISSDDIVQELCLIVFSGKFDKIKFASDGHFIAYLLTKSRWLIYNGKTSASDHGTVEIPEDITSSAITITDLEIAEIIAQEISDRVPEGTISRKIINARIDVISTEATLVAQRADIPIASVYEGNRRLQGLKNK